MFGKKKRIIAEQEERIAELEKQIETLSADNKRLKERVIDVERRERGIGRALNEATATADNMIADAQRKSAVILDQMQAECESQRKKAERIVDDAYRNAREIVREAENEGEKKRDEMQKQIEQYAALLNGYDAMVQEQLQMAQDNAKRFAELSRALHESVPKLLGADGAPLPGLSENGSDAESKQDEPSYLREDLPDYHAGSLRYEPSRDGGSGDEQLWTVDKIATGASDGAGSDVDAIIDEILAATEDDA
jgi:hypothetical protein